MNAESAPKGAQESATTALIVPDEAEIQASQLSRIETILDRIVGSRASLAGAR